MVRLSRLTVWIILTFGFGLSAVPTPAAQGTEPAAAEADRPSVAHIRANRPAVAGLIREATAHSVMFRQLVDTIQRTDGIVYVEEGECGRQRLRACLLMWMSATGRNRFLRVLVDPRRADSEADMMGSIGHELQHAIEALSDPATTDGVRLYNFFRRLAPTDSARFETTAAINAGNTVYDEVRRR
jgi:hypothetical protein